MRMVEPFTISGRLSYPCGLSDRGKGMMADGFMFPIWGMQTDPEQRRASQYMKETFIPEQTHSPPPSRTDTINHAPRGVVPVLSKIEHIGNPGRVGKSAGPHRPFRLFTQKPCRSDESTRFDPAILQYLPTSPQKNGCLVK